MNKYDYQQKARISRVIQTKKPSRKAKARKAKEEHVLEQYRHSQEEIQQYIVALWLDDSKQSFENELDQKKAKYMQNYANKEGGWCDGWAYTLVYHPEELLDIWGKIDKAIDGEYDLTATDRFNAVELAKKASLYHIVNNTPDEDQMKDYNNAGYNLERKPNEIWHSDEDTELPIYEIKRLAKQLSVGDSLRLTSPTHDSSIYRKSKTEYIVAETELSGIQYCKDIGQVVEILEKWKKDRDENGELFFTQYLIV